MNLTQSEAAVLLQLLQNATEEELQKQKFNSTQKKKLLRKLEDLLPQKSTQQSLFQEESCEANESKDAFPAEVILFTDGASRGNPGPAGYGFLVTTANEEEVYSDYGYLGEATNNVAEYQALLEGLKACLAHQAQKVKIKADSELMVKQLTGQYRVKNPNLVPIYHKIKSQLQNLEWSISHIRREFNSKADALANQGIDDR